MEVLTRAVEKLSIEEQADRQESRSKSELDERFFCLDTGVCLSSQTSTPRCRGPGKGRSLPVFLVNGHLHILIYLGLNYMGMG